MDDRFGSLRRGATYFFRRFLDPEMMERFVQSVIARL
jgi:hypothetical protein